MSEEQAYQDWQDAVIESAGKDEEITRLRSELAEAWGWLKDTVTQLIDRELQLRARVAALEEVVEAARRVAWCPSGANRKRLEQALAKLEGS